VIVLEYDIEKVKERILLTSDVSPEWAETGICYNFEFQGLKLSDVAKEMCFPYHDAVTYMSTLIDHPDGIEIFKKRLGK